LVIGGAIGNVIDRIRFGAVVDFLNMSCCGIQNPYIFNLADIFVFTGLILLVVFLERFQK
jgi:signal peptidase II